MREGSDERAIGPLPYEGRIPVGDLRITVAAEGYDETLTVDRSGNALVVWDSGPTVRADGSLLCQSGRWGTTGSRFRYRS